MGKFKTPQEKKRLSYQHDRRDDYGESKSSAAKSVRWRKRWVNQTYRQEIKHILNSPIDKEDTDQIENRIDEAKKPSWKKSSHAPLGLLLHSKGKLGVDKIKKLTFRVSDTHYLDERHLSLRAGGSSGDRQPVPEEDLHPNKRGV
ncbi:hypothetical protein [Spirosoma sp.]|uniref:hypothetical protein n=1 Tax=Spirosoma sp. TaxID=1899569 RepID=UPI0026137ECC|nr:hypothetical protein [Spirosoma sp.]MCX6215351.1 hypothetical protein [Spirosoma sp.]